MSAAPNDQTNLCARCRKGTTAPVTVDAMYTHEGETVHFKETFMKCDHCGREFFTAEQSQAQQKSITNALRTLHGFLTGDEILAARKSYGLNQSDFEKALGVGKNTVGRWERGTVPPSQAANLGLWVAANAPDVFEKWARMRGVRITRVPQKDLTAALRSEVSTSATVDLRAFAMAKAVDAKATKQTSLNPATAVGEYR